MFGCKIGRVRLKSNTGLIQCVKPAVDNERRVAIQDLSECIRLKTKAVIWATLDTDGTISRGFSWDSDETLMQEAIGLAEALKIRVADQFVHD